MFTCNARPKETRASDEIVLKFELYVINESIELS